MAELDYSAADALARLLAMVRERIPELSQEIQATIDQGKDEDIVERDPLRKSRAFRRKAALTDQEALALSVDVLQAYFVELPLFVRSASQDLQVAALEDRLGRAPHSQGDVKAISIAGQTETQRVEGRSEPLKPSFYELTAPTPQSVREREARLDRIRALSRIET